MRWTYRDVLALPVPVFERVVAFCNEHVVGKGSTPDDWE
jgi:hypothetical protein